MINDCFVSVGDTSAVRRVRDEDGFRCSQQPLINSQIETIQKAIVSVSEGDTALPLIISADAKAPYQSIITAMDAAGKEGFRNIQMATRKDQNE